ncbi:MAG TPA: CPBP family intramembrane glutamic endopeptidase [Chloroflexota bacterium]|nr:CPBP family intramembrane glutamic endopeptidase [Chloroflexota bacterium]
MSTESPQIQRMIARLTVGSFAAELILAEGWLRLARGMDVTDLILQGDNLLPAVAVGLLLAVAIALGSRAFFSRFTPELIRTLFVPILGHTTSREVALMALLPGLGEELLFRGTIQPEIGLVWTSLVFGALHSGFSRELLPYGLWATGVGAILGGLYMVTGNLWGCIAAHSVVNAMGALWLRRMAGTT